MHAVQHRTKLFTVLEFQATPPLTMLAVNASSVRLASRMLEAPSAPPLCSAVLLRKVQRSRFRSVAESCRVAQQSLVEAVISCTRFSAAQSVQGIGAADAAAPSTAAVNNIQ